MSFFTKLFQKNECTATRSSSVRRAILFRQSGLCDVSYFVNAEGEVRSADDVCVVAKNAMPRKFWLKHTTDHLEQQGKEWREAEKYQDASTLSKAQTKVLDEIYASDAAKSVAAFRKAVMNASVLNVRGIHFFHWDGTCRDVKSIYIALDLYPPSHAKMQILTGLLVGSTVAALGASAVRATIKSRRQRKLSSSS